MKKSEIRFSIALDEQSVPEAISWQATDAGEQINFAKAVNISLWDRDDAGTRQEPATRSQRGTSQIHSGAVNDQSWSTPPVTATAATFSVSQKTLR